MNVDPAWIALFGTLFGGVALKISERLLSGSRDKNTDAQEIRAELRTSVSEQRTEIKDLEDEVNEWRSKYYDLRDSYAAVQVDLQIALTSIKHEANEATRRLEDKT